jgi:hypothetical protein
MTSPSGTPAISINRTPDNFNFADLSTTPGGTIYATTPGGTPHRTVPHCPPQLALPFFVAPRASLLLAECRPEFAALAHLVALD